MPLATAAAKMEHMNARSCCDWLSTRHTYQISWLFLIFSSVAEKNLPLSRGYFGCWGHALVAVVVVERFKEESMYWLSGGQNKVAVVETEVAVSGASTKFDHPASISFIISITSKLSCPSCSLVSLDFNHIVEGVTDREAVNSRQFRKCGRDYFSSFRIERRKCPTKFKSTAWRLERNKPSSISLSWGEDRKRF